MPPPAVKLLANVTPMETKRAVTTAMIELILIAAFMLNFILSSIGVPQAVATTIAVMTLPGISETLVRVNYSETDQMGVAYHARYLVWLDVARTEHLRLAGADHRVPQMRPAAHRPAPGGPAHRPRNC